MRENQGFYADYSAIPSTRQGVPPLGERAGHLPGYLDGNHDKHDVPDPDARSRRVSSIAQWPVRS